MGGDLERVASFFFAQPKFHFADCTTPFQPIHRVKMAFRPDFMPLFELF